MVRKKWQRLNGNAECTANRCRQRITLSAVQRPLRVLLHLAEPAPVSANGSTLNLVGGNTLEVTYELPAVNEQEIYVQGTAASRLLSTAWLEVVPANYVTRVLAETVASGEAINVSISTPEPEMVELELREGARVVAASKGKTGERIWLKPEKPHCWSPADPFLYQLHVKLGTGDSVESYAAMRTVSVAKDLAGVPRILLNGKPYFSFGLLADDTAPSPAALLRMGFNSVRLRAIQSPRWYATCDRLGLLVWQGVPKMPTHLEIRRAAISTVEALRAFPSIAMWTLFDEGREQEAYGLDNARVLTGEITRLDPTRLVNGASGWFDTANGHVHDLHFTPGPGMFVIGQRRAVVLGKFGELQADTRGDLRRLYRELMGKLSLYRAMGLSAAIYSPAPGQSLSQQFGEEWLGTLNRRMLDNEPQVETLAGGEEPLDYTLAEPGTAREGWRAGSGIFGKAQRNIQPGVAWTAPAIRLRRSFRWDGKSDEVYLVTWAIRGASLDVKLNGTSIAIDGGQTDESPRFLPLKGKGALIAGDNQITIDARRSSPDAAFEARLISVTADKLGFAEPELTQRTEYPLVAIDHGTADLARLAPQFSLVRSRRGRPAGVARAIPFIRDMPAASTPEQIYYALLASRDDGFNGANIHVQAATESERIESELKIRNMQEWFKQYANAYPVLHATGLTAPAFARKPAKAALLFTPTPEKPRPPDAIALAAFPGAATSAIESWLENLSLLARAAQSRWPLIPESDGSLFAYATFLLGIEPRTNEPPTRLSVPLAELDAHFFWPIGDPAESLPPNDLDKYKLPNTTIYRRRFTNGIVAVNPGGQPQTLRLDNALMDAATRQVLSTIELPAHSAKILLRPGTVTVTQ
ncbi:MAG: hypothetical protein ABI972_02660 [Acidobacteriota bacterium]